MGDETDRARSSEDGPGPGGPLHGIRVVELGGLVAASFAGRLLGDMGAEVIKVEAPNVPDPLRIWGRLTEDGRSPWWAVQSRNKKLITLDLRKPAGADLLAGLCAQADVLLENFRPGTLEEWGIGYERLAAANSGLILARISGFGQTGPMAHRPGYAAVAEAMGGLRYVNGYPDRPPPRFGISLGDSLAGMFAVQGVLAALHERGHSGRGQVVDVALTESCLALMEGALAEYDCLGTVRKPTGTRLPRVAPANLFQSRDGNWIVLAAQHDKMFESLCRVMQRPELARDERFSNHVIRGENQDEIEEIVAEWISQHDFREVDQMLVEAGIVAGPVYSVAEIMSDPQFAARDAIVVHKAEDLGDIRAQGVTPKFSRTPGDIRWAGPWKAGAHNENVFGEVLGIDASGLAALRQAGVI